MSQELLFPVQRKDELQVIAHSGRNTWPELTEAISLHNLEYPFFLGKPTESLDTLFHIACLEAHVPPSEGSPYKLPLVRLVTTTIGHDALISQPRFIELLFEEFHKAKTSPPFRHIFVFPEHPFADDIKLPTLDDSLKIAVHALPHPLKNYCD